MKSKLNIKEEIIELNTDYINKRLDFLWLFRFLKLQTSYLELKKIILIPSIILWIISVVILYATKFNIRYNVLSMISFLTIIIFILAYLYFFAPPIILVLRMFKPKTASFNEKIYRQGTMLLIFGFFVYINFLILLGLNIFYSLGFENIPYYLQIIILGVIFIGVITIIYPNYFWNYLLSSTKEKRKHLKR